MRTRARVNLFIELRTIPDVPTCRSVTLCRHQEWQSCTLLTLEFSAFFARLAVPFFRWNTTETASSVGRCKLTANCHSPAPAGVGNKKFDETVASMIALLKYGRGFPFNRLDGLQRDLDIPLPASTQWDIVHAPIPILIPVLEELVRQGAAGEVVHNDDTTVKIVEWMGKRSQQPARIRSIDDAERDPGRKGLFTSGVVSIRENRRIALFFRGRKHAGENLQEVLKRAARPQLPLAGIQMCDALSRNLPGPLETIVANCLAHGRRQFVDLCDRFPNECRHVLESLAVIYRHDAQTRRRNGCRPTSG